ncbi:MAG: undecaprenyl/decaprenyl-phosphate alpha-N-acetylglucosaminyl 1-phosphate transferase [Fimbriimonadia bacterium]|nr:undecaprenyl/decaprenyl-phosphate alpha-N-acetylglucosaminyl 1-phosphate transferase [Fimbriimonadia bacterium]
MKTITAVFLIALVVTYLLTPWVRQLAMRKGVMDIPDKRRVHTDPIPRWGGLAIYVGVMVACLLGLARLYLLADSLPVFIERAMPLIGLLVTGTLVTAVGMLDDKYQFSAVIQLGTLLFAGFIVQVFGVQIEGINNPFGGDSSSRYAASRWVQFGWMAIPITAIWIFVITKTMDTIDGLDGLAAGVSAIAGLALALMALQAADMNDQPYPHWLIAIAAAAITGAAAGFLRYNFNPAKIFMGTGGAQFLGFMLAGLSILGTFKAATAFAIVVPVLVFGLPILDAVTVVIRRLLSKQPIYQADKRHIHHKLIELGLTHKQTVLLLYGVALIFAVVAVWLFRTLLSG